MVEIEIRLYCYLKMSCYSIYLYYDSAQMADEYFWKPIRYARDDLSYSGAVTLIETSSAFIEGKRHFIKDYKENERYEIRVRGNSSIGEGDFVIGQAEFVYENDISTKENNDLIAIKNVRIKFKNSACKKTDLNEKK